MISMVRNISIKDELYERLSEIKGKKDSFSDVIEGLFDKVDSCENKHSD